MKVGRGRETAELQRGFTLTELMITVVILAIIASIAIPMYDQFALAARRSDARAVLNEIASLQAEHLLNHSAYAGSLADLNYDSESTNEFYSLSLNAVGSTSFSATATAQGVQISDAECATFTITHTGARTATDKTSADSTDTCW